ncbi:MAG: DMT family transporter [Proteobacteria bacterium]|nr:DMT family transporter [Pseudomonadota bacterium]
MTLSFAHSGEFFSALSALIWAFAVIFYRKSGEHVSPVALNLFKNTIAMGLFLLTMVIIGVPFASGNQTTWDWIILLISGAVGIGIADTVFFASLNRLGAGRSAIVDCLYSIFVILCSFIYLHEPIGITLLFALVFILAGIMIGTWKPARIDLKRDLQQIRYGILLGIIAMLLMAVGIVMAKPIISTSNPWWACLVRLIGGMGFLLIQVTFKRDRSDIKKCFTPGHIWKFTVPSAVVGTYFANFFWVVGMKFTFATVASVFNQMSTIFVLVLATLFLKEPLTGRKTVAIILGFTGGIIAAF